MTIEEKIIQAVVAGVKALYDADVTADQVQLQKTKKEFEGHLTVVVFPFVKIARKKPEDVAAELGKYLQDNAQDVVASYNVVKGFLNIVVSPASWIQLLNEISADEKFGFKEATNDSPLVMIEYSSPNTNKPLHLGHMR
ncbi:MAG: arginine--tRNA ligase, partial [Bacteroidaceae bacterium]|nr:arginine--tRNA ligase [Bacteroidaceae bacterium]